MLRAANATLQIQSRGCGGVLFGSGFPVANDLVVTNAHVVAGSRRHEVITNKDARPRPPSSTSTRTATWPCCRSPTPVGRCAWPRRRPGRTRRRW